MMETCSPPNEETKENDLKTSATIPYNESTMETSAAIPEATDPRPNPNSVGLRQEIFTTAIAAGASGREAAEVAGYGSNDNTRRYQASKLLSDPNVLAQARAKLHQGLEELGLTPRWSLEKLQSLIEKSLTGEQPQLMAGVKGIELLAKLQGVLVDKGSVEITVNADAGLSLQDKQNRLRSYVELMHNRMQELDAPEPQPEPDENVIDAEYTPVGSPLPD